MTRVLSTLWTAGFVVSLLGVSTGLRAQDAASIEFFTSSFLPQAVSVEIGNPVQFLWRRGEHTVTSGRGPEDPLAGSLFDATLNEENPVFTFEPEEPFPEGIAFFDRVHPTQQGFIEVTGGEIDVRVGVVDNVFLPEEVFIFAGDSVRWEHEPMEAFHTITSGVGAEAPDAGQLFDAPSSDDQPVFVYQFLEPAIYPYFCRPHEQLGMVGTVWVQHLFIRADSSGDRLVDISDAVLTLGVLFLGSEAQNCDDALDANDDGLIDIGDAIVTLNHLFLGTAEIPPPFERLGADRTEDGLFCLAGP